MRWIVLHHTGITGMAEQLQAVNNSHCKRWNNPSPITGYCVEYHYFVGKDGTVVQTRDESERTGHTRNALINDHSIAVVLAGNFNVEDLTNPQAKAVHALLLRLKKEYPDATLIPHKEASPTACPGDRIMQLLLAAHPNP